MLGTDLWESLRAAHRRNFDRRFSETAEDVDPDSRLKPPRYWLVHTLAHVLIRELAMTCGYSAASLSERLYAWPEADGRAPAAGLLIVTTASDSDGTLGGLVQLSSRSGSSGSSPWRSRRATRCSSDPICAQAHPAGPGGLPARRGLPLLRHGVGDLLRAGQPLPRPAVPHQPARERCLASSASIELSRQRPGSSRQAARPAAHRHRGEGTRRPPRRRRHADRGAARHRPRPPPGGQGCLEAARRDAADRSVPSSRCCGRSKERGPRRPRSIRSGRCPATWPAPAG